MKNMTGLLMLAIAASQSMRGREGSCGSWLCENAAAGSLNGLGCSATTLREVWEQYLADFVYNAT